MGEGRVMATSNSREERRRKIVDRGSDRLALITGKIPNLSSSSPSSPVSTPPYRSLNQSSSSRDYRDNPPSILSNQIHAGNAGALAASISTLLKNESSDNASKENTFDTEKQVEPEVYKSESNREVIQPYTVDNSTKSEPLPEKSTVAKTSNAAEVLQKPSKNELNNFSCKQINFCIIASQGTRSFCALVIALFVVLSYTDDALLGMNIVSSEIVEALRPLYILLLTDITIVLKKLFLEQRKQFEVADKEKVEPQEDGDNWTQAIQLMERGLVVYQSMRAIFIDFSIYTVVVVCGLSFV